MSSNNEALLVKAYIQGDESALSQLIDLHKDRIFGFIYSKVMNREVADDIFQDTFIKAIITLKGGRYNEEGKFLPWIMRIAHNLTIDYFRAKKRMPTVNESFTYDAEEVSVFDFIGDGEEGVELKLIREQIEGDVKGLVALLPKDQKEVLDLRIFRDMSFKEIAEETGVSINTALGRMRYALINLRKLIEEKNVSIVLD